MSCCRVMWCAAGAARLVSLMQQGDSVAGHAHFDDEEVLLIRHTLTCQKVRNTTVFTRTNFSSGLKGCTPGAGGNRDTVTACCEWLLLDHTASCMQLLSLCRMA